VAAGAVGGGSSGSGSSRSLQFISCSLTF
jgi:hypothetical protein